MNAPRSVVVAVAILSGAALAYEILLIRLFAIVDWHHLAFLIISIALLGYGASGTFIAIARISRYAEVASLNAMAFAVASVTSFFVLQRIEFNSLEIIWSRREMGKLFVLYLLFAVPFFCAATAIGLTLTRFSREAPRIYRADLIGAGTAAALIIALLFAVHPVTALQCVAATALVAAILFARRRAGELAGIVIVLLFILAARPFLLPIRISQFKELSQTLRLPGARVIEERSSPLALLSVVESPQVPLRFAPGLSLNYTEELPPQIGIFSDGSGLTAVTRQDPYLDFVPSAAPYHLRESFERVAIIGAGGGAEVHSALLHRARHVVAVELNPQVIEIAGYRDPRVKVVSLEGRRFIVESKERFDLIQIALVDSFGGSAAGVHALSESYLYTVEAIEEMVRRLRDGGYLVITRWMQIPPRDVVKLLATASVALQQPSRSVALVRTWNTASIIIKRGTFDTSEVAALRGFCEERSFDLDYAPGVRREETNRYNLLDDPALFDVASAILGAGAARDDFLDRYKFFVRPATDDRPYFFHFFKWRVFPELLRLRGRSGTPLVEWGYVILIAAIAQALIAAVLLLVLPLVVMRHRPATSVPRLAIFYGSIGLAFLFIEIAWIQHLTLFLGHPLYAVAVVLASVLVFAGVGSGKARQRWPLLAIAILALIQLPIVRLLLHATIGMSQPVKVLIALAVMAPLAILMGMPFPSAVSRLEPSAVPWAWAVNGTASVLSPMLATLIAVHFGFSAVIAAAALLYLVAWRVTSVRTHMSQ
jgi:SAM-dependent methyltransferase